MQANLATKTAFYFTVAVQPSVKPRTPTHGGGIGYQGRSNIGMLPSVPSKSISASRQRNQIPTMMTMKKDNGQMPNIFNQRV